MLLCLPVPFNPKNRSKIRWDTCHRCAGSLSAAHERHLTRGGGCAVCGAPTAPRYSMPGPMPCKSTVHVTKTQFTVTNTIILNSAGRGVISGNVLTLGRQSTHRTGPTAKHNPVPAERGSLGCRRTKMPRDKPEDPNGPSPAHVYRLDPDSCQETRDTDLHFDSLPLRGCVTGASDNLPGLRIPLL